VLPDLDEDAVVVLVGSATGLPIPPPWWWCGFASWAGRDPAVLGDGAA
jgi:hypothetical protein